MEDKQAIPVAIYTDKSMLNISFDKILIGRKVTVEKSDGSAEILTITDFNRNFIDNPMTGAKELTVHVSFGSETEV